ncbi:hypothetical protein [Pseudomonas costantinii]|uniref:DUF2752 domain-containing protein n=1 Tax=Pseudomonas costantinii TaxID=168469 RepID=A0A1S2UAR3_9PSED|nr:hypothetical protein [Pseudomonas costantinii]OIN43359.1 hypothetical protein BFL40_32445 [Pseudomonas costantinii]SEE37622.1 hypothetical protein SAMN04515675_5206 [Pseudomonas costantinii]
MRTRCPNCGTTISLDALIAHDGARDALGLAFKLSGQLGNSLIRYVGLFRPETRELTMDRVAKILAEVVPDIQAQRIERNGVVFNAPAACWIWAIEQTLGARDSGRLATPLKGHGWLYQVMSQWPGEVTSSALMPVTSEVKPATLARPSQTTFALQALQERLNG